MLLRAGFTISVRRYSGACVPDTGRRAPSFCLLRTDRFPAPRPPYLPLSRLVAFPLFIHCGAPPCSSAPGSLFRLGVTRAPACRIPDVGRPRSASLSSLPGTPPCRIRVTLLIARALPCRMPVVARPRSTFPGLLGPADFPGSPPCPFIAGVPFVPDTGRLVPSPFPPPPALDGRSLDGDCPLGHIITP